MSVLEPQTEQDAASLVIPLTPVPADQIVDGAPEAGFIELTAVVGVWEHTPGTSTDVEDDEVFVVLSGRATVRWAGGELTLRPGTVGRLSAGTETIWTVTETLRKVYVTGGA
ncbi:cupin domain-containing protein [Microbacterium oleivorans]|uniref:cupin domain-containing protein n=1 Tax=Microbacterium oleivorans TaxID=273677 RepID=UPI00203B46A3|nr:cupin domain-containing protein [Microbacterium oleivorans]MCM3695473.1 cupin domain-containing protein [Microbacterium oleivorans]